MKRPSHVIENLVSGIDALSGKCYSKHDDYDFTDNVCGFGVGYVIADVALVSADVVLTGVAKALESCVARPLYHLENLVADEAPEHGWIFF